MAEPLLYGVEVAAIRDFLHELFQASFCIDHPITVETTNAVVTIAHGDDEDFHFHITDVKKKDASS